MWRCALLRCALLRSGVCSAASPSTHACSNDATDATLFFFFFFFFF